LMPRITTAKRTTIAKANGISKENVPKIKSIFARSWVDQARSGWWIQDSQGNWRKK
jgi:uncharacterized protein YdbL (DUF1318 family)